MAVVATTALGRGTVQVNRSALYPMLPVLAAALGLSGAQTGAIASAYFLAYVGLMVPAGLLGDRFGLKRMAVLAYTLSWLGVVALGLVARNYPLILLATIAQGLGAGAYFPSAYALLMKAVPPLRRGSSMGFVFVGTSLGTGLGFIISGALYGLTERWWATFLILSVPTMLVVMTCQLVLREAPPGPRTPVVGSLRPIFGHRNLMVLTTSYFCSLFGLSVVITWGTGYLAAERGLSLPWAASYTSLVALAAIPTTMTLGRLSDRWGRKRLSVGLLAVAGLVIALLATLEPPAVLLLLLAIYGMIGPLAQGPVFVAWCGDLVVGSRLSLGAAMGVFNAAGMSSAFIAPVVGGWMWDATGSLESAFYTAAGVVLLGALLALLPRETVARGWALGEPPSA